MAELDIARRRLYSQGLAGGGFERPEEVVGWMGAVQAQDYPAAKWALGLRLRGAVDDDVERAFAEGTILRTHVMRPTWHFVLPADIRWLLALTGPRVNAVDASNYRTLQLDEALFARSHNVLAKALEGGQQLTRPELGATLQQAGINTQDSRRLAHIMMRAELDGVVCSGARRGAQFTYALLDERAPRARRLERDEALAELTLRYFRSHGPAQVKDLVWWSGLTTGDIKAGIEMVKSHLAYETIEGRTYWFAESTPFESAPSPTAYLLPNFDEYSVAYRDRSALVDPSSEKQDPQDSFYLGNLIVIDGKVVGSWKRTFSRGALVITTQLITRLNEVQKEAIAAAANKYGAFLGMPVILS
ncbi:MAG: winged helix DNA-binding domain-containing protein [Chloroflexota bacterium]|nr:winged helix DNA-binding domain-containing protein [Chloroflexota bacterium]MDQ5865843.1 winged helix DNA-binding domain-containing protein [Chloroflexota bacterium]